LHVPASIAADLRAAGGNVQDAAGWALATDDDHDGSMALLLIKNTGVVIIVVGLLRRQWALALFAVALLFIPTGLFYHKPTAGEALMTSVAPFLDHPEGTPLAANPRSPGAVQALPRLNSERFHKIGETPRPFVPPVQVPPPPVARIHLSLDDVAPGKRADMAYLLAQAAFKDDDVRRTASFYADLGRDYPQKDRITRDRIRVLADYLTAHNALPYEPKPASPWAFEIKQTENGDFALLVRLALFAALLLEVVGLFIRRRAKKIGRRLTALGALAPA